MIIVAPHSLRMLTAYRFAMRNAAPLVRSAIIVRKCGQFSGGGVQVYNINTYSTFPDIHGGQTLSHRGLSTASRLWLHDVTTSIMRRNAVN